MYIDANLESNIDFLLNTAEKFTKILSSIKYYPYPTVMYKMILNPNITTTTVQTQTTPQKTISAPKPINKKPNNTNNSTTTKTEPKKPESQLTTQNSEPTNNDSDLLTQVFQRISKTSVKKSFKDHVILDKIEHNLAHLIVINKMSEMLIKKEDTVSEIEKIISEILGENTKISITYQKKEDYFANLL
jgi:hypothetical protein